jgi:uncharacterized membrane protein YtjA (UPF0391 family)
MHLRLWPNLLLMGALVSGVCGFMGVGMDAERAEFARGLFCIFAAVLVPFFVLKLARS